MDRTAKSFLIIVFTFGMISAQPNSTWCPSDGLIAQSDGTCLVVLHYITFFFSHYEAASQCRSFSSYQNEYQLPTIKTVQKHRELGSWLRNYTYDVATVRSEYYYMWLNLEREFTSQPKDLSIWRRRTDWRWRDGNSSASDAVSESMWTMWRNGTQLPDYVAGYEAGERYCVSQFTLSGSPQLLYWFERSCCMRHAATVIVCEKKPPIARPTTTSTPTPTTIATPIPTTTSTYMYTSSLTRSPSTAKPTSSINNMTSRILFENATSADIPILINGTCTPLSRLLTLTSTGAITILVILYLLGGILFIVGLYFFISAKRRLREARNEVGGKIHYHVTNDNID